MKELNIISPEYYVLGIVIAYLIGHLLVYNLLRKIVTEKSNKASNVVQLMKDHREPLKTSDVSLNDEKPDIIIVGAGVAGSALACTLGKDGRRVQVIERDLREADRMVGELLQPGGYLKLVELGLEDCVKDIDAQIIIGQALYKDGRNTMMSYPSEKFRPDVSGRCFHNGRFIQKMRDKAATFPNVRLEQGTVTSLIEENGTVKGVKYKTNDGRQLTACAPLTIVCDGCFSNLRRSLCNNKVEVIPSSFVGFILKDCQLPYANRVVLVMSDPSVIYFYPISSTEIRCVVDIPGQKLPSIANGEMANYLKTFMAPQVPHEFRDAFITAVEEGNIRTMPTKRMPASSHSTPGSLLIGDAFNMRHPLVGGGMTVALSDIVVLRDLLRPLPDFNDANALCHYLEPFYTLRKPLASTINIVAGVAYQIFCSSTDPTRKDIREAVFGYLSLGGIFSGGVAELFAGLNPRPLSLVAHLIGIAAYAVGCLLLPFPTPKRAWRGLKMLSVGFGVIIFPSFKEEGLGQTFFPATLRAYHRALAIAQN